MVQEGFLARFFRLKKLAASTGLLTFARTADRSRVDGRLPPPARFRVPFLFSQAKEFVMSNLTKASRELFKRQPDECFPSLTALWEHCQRQKEACVDR